MVAFLKEHDTENASLSAPKRIDKFSTRSIRYIYFLLFIEGDLTSFQIHNK